MLRETYLNGINFRGIVLFDNNELLSKNDTLGSLTNG